MLAADLKARWVRFAVAASAAIGVFGAPVSAQAQAPDFPQKKPLNILITLGPGSASDTIARLVGQKVAESLGVPLVPENKLGAMGNVASQFAKRAAPDGHTLLLHSTSVVINTALYANAGYDTLTDFLPVAMGPRTANVIVVHPSVPATTLRELLDLAKKQPMSYASSGTGSTTHLSVERLKLLAGVDITHVPHQPVQAIQNTLAGHVLVASTSLPPAIPHIRSGKLRAIAVSTATRATAVPEVPTIAESGYPGFDDSTWFGFFAPLGTPAATVDRLNAEINRAMEAPDVREKLAGLGLESRRATVAEFAAFLRAEAPKWAKAVKDSGAKVD